MLSASKVTTASFSGQDHPGLDELVRLGHELDRGAPGRKPDGVAGEAHGTLRHLDLDHALAPDLQCRALHLLHGRLARRVHCFGVVGQLHVLPRLLHGRAGAAPGGVDEAGAEGEPDGPPAGALEQGEVTGREVGHEGHGQRGVGARSAGILAGLHRPHRCTHELDVNVVRVHRRPRPARRPHRARAPCRTRRAAGGRPDPRRRCGRPRPCEMAPLPQFHTPTGTDTTATPTHEVERLPSGGVEQKRLVDRQVRGDAPLSRMAQPAWPGTGRLRSISARTSGRVQRRPRQRVRSALLMPAAPWAGAAPPGRSP